MGKGEGAKSTGYRAGTRDLFTKKFRSNGYNAPITTFMRNYKVGDVVDVVCDSRQQKGMPHKYYHGRTGKVWNVSKRCADSPASGEAPGGGGCAAGSVDLRSGG